MPARSALTAVATVTLSLLAACGEQSAAPAASTPAAAPATTVAASSNASAAAPASPQTAVNRVVAGPISAEPGMVDFGLVEPRAMVEVEVTLTNSSDQPVEIVASKPTCQCTTVDMTGKVIPARGSITMPVSMQTSAAVGVKQAAV